MNPGHSGAWVNPDTGGQGFLLDVMPDTNLAFLAWFTYDTSLPAAGVTAQVGDPGHRWLTAQGPVNGNKANLDVYVTSGGLFDNPTPVSRAGEGDITLTFDSCSSGTVDYRLTSAGLSGSIPIERIVPDNVALCESIGKMQKLEERYAPAPTKNTVVAENPEPGFQTKATLQNCRINPGHNGAWVNPDTGGQGFLLDVMPDTNLAFLAWFTYDTSLPAAGVTAQVGDPGHRWLTAQGPVNGNKANLDVYVTSGGLFDNPTPVSRAGEGDITLTFDSCSSGTVDYRLTSAGLSGSIPIERIVPDNVALCMALCGEVVTENSGRQAAVLGLAGGELEIIDTQKNVSRLTIPEGILAGSRDHRLEALPLSRQTVLPTGHTAIAGMQWISDLDPVIGPARLEMFTKEAENYADIAAFFYGLRGESFYFIPLLFNDEAGVVLEVPSVFPGITGIAYVTSDEMEQWSPPDNPPSARYLHEMAITAKKAIEAEVQKQAKIPAMYGVVEAGSGGSPNSSGVEFVIGDLFLRQMKEWFDNEIAPRLGVAGSGCEHATEFATLGVEWLSWVAEVGLDGHKDLTSRVSALESAFDSLGQAAGQDISDMDEECELEPDPCKQMVIMQEGAVCAQTMQFLGEESSIPELACSNAPAVLSVVPKNTKRCPGGNIEFTAVVRNLRGEGLDVDQSNLQWFSESEQLLSIDKESGAAKAIAEGHVWVKATSEVCDMGMEAYARVKIDGVPDIGGNYSLVGSETIRGCIDPEYNGTYGGTGTASIIMGADSGQSSTASFSGSSSGSGFGHFFSGTVSCGGSLSGSGTYTEEEAVGVSNFTGTYSGNTIMIYGSGQDTIGDTCRSTGWARATKTN